MIKFGADDIITSKNLEDYTDDDIEQILKESEEKTRAMKEKLDQQAASDNFSLYWFEVKKRINI